VPLDSIGRLDRTWERRRETPTADDDTYNENED
jgi:hypothetical protein